MLINFQPLCVNHSLIKMAKKTSSLISCSLISVDSQPLSAITFILLVILSSKDQLLVLPALTRSYQNTYIILPKQSGAQPIIRC